MTLGELIIAAAVDGDEAARQVIAQAMWDYLDRTMPGKDVDTALDELYRRQPHTPIDPR